MGMWMCAAFGLVCLGFALSGFAGLSSSTDPAERELIAGYAAFWGFLAAVALVFGGLSWMIKTGRLGRSD